MQLPCGSRLTCINLGHFYRGGLEPYQVLHSTSIRQVRLGCTAVDGLDGLDGLKCDRPAVRNCLDFSSVRNPPCGTTGWNPEKFNNNNKMRTSSCSNILFSSLLLLLLLLLFLALLLLLLLLLLLSLLIWH